MKNQNGSPFPQIPAKVYAYLKAQVPDSLSDAPADIGRDATEEIYLAYFRDNHGVHIVSWEDRDPRSQIVKQRATATAHHALMRRQAQELGRDALKDAAQHVVADQGLDADAVKTYWAAQNGGCEDLVLLTHLAAAGLRMRALFEGPPGIGKSRATVEIIDALALPDAGRIKVVSGHVTPLAAYQLLYDYREPTSLLVFDESFPLANREVQALLKDALFLGDVAWTSTHDLPDLPSHFTYEGNVVVNANSLGTGADTAALRDRLCCLKLALTKQQLFEKMKAAPVRRPALDGAVRDRVVGLRAGRIRWPSLTDADVAYVTTALEAATRDWPVYAPLSFRHLQKGLTLLQGIKGLFGWTPPARKWYEDILARSLDAADPAIFILNAVAHAGGRLKMTELRDLAMTHYGIGRTQAYERITALKEQGLLEEDGHRTAILTNH